MPPFDVNEDGSAKDPTAYKNAVMGDEAKMKMLTARHLARMLRWRRVFGRGAVARAQGGRAVLQRSVA
jgi:hypothetical protein